MRFVPHEYQSYAIDRVINQEKIGLFMDMGLGLWQDIGHADRYRPDDG